MNGKNKIIGGAIVVLILIGGFLWWNGSRSSDPITKDDTNSAKDISENTNADIVEKAYTQTRVKENGVYVTTVSYTADGFVPPIVYINHGESVRFINKNEDSMRIASNQYQSTTLYSGFGQEKTVGINGTYEFIFNQKGVWGYNNLNSIPRSYGIVYVR